MTAPSKLDAFAYATARSERATLAGAVNAMKFDAERVYAENFDGVGLTTDIEHNLGRPLTGMRVLLLGAGGAARGALKPFLDAWPAGLVIANRTPEKARVLAATFSAYRPTTAVECVDLAELPPFDIVVNATSASLFSQLPSIPVECFAEGCLAYELAAVPEARAVGGRGTACRRCRHARRTGGGSVPMVARRSAEHAGDDRRTHRAARLSAPICGMSHIRHREESMIRRYEDVTPAALEAMERTADPRLREIMTSLVRHLHGFIKERRLTEAEFRAATAVLAEMGRLTADSHQEFVLMAGSLGMSRSSA